MGGDENTQPEEERTDSKRPQEEIIRTGGESRVHPKLFDSEEGSTVNLEKIRERSRKRKQKVTKPDPTEEHEIYKHATEEYWRTFELTESGRLHEVSREPVDQSAPPARNDYRCTCGAMDMTYSQAATHIELASDQ